MSKDEAGNQTPDTPDVSETELRNLKVDELRERAQEDGVEGASSMRKEELVRAVAQAEQDRTDGESQRDSEGRRDSEDQRDGQASTGAGPDGGHVRTGPDTSKSLKYSQEISSPDQEPERAGRSLVTTHHDVIRQWAQERGGVPATVTGTEHGDHLGVLRIDFRETGPDDSGESRLREVSWDEWFATFDARRLNFIYQENRSDGRQSTFFRLESPDREDG